MVRPLRSGSDSLTAHSLATAANSPPTGSPNRGSTSLGRIRSASIARTAAMKAVHVSFAKYARPSWLTPILNVTAE